MKKLFTISILTIGLIVFANAQGITNTLGGNTENDKFIVENSNSDSGLVITGEGNVGIGTSSPISKLHIYDDVNSSLSLRIQNTNTGTGAATKLYFDGSNHAGISVFGPSFSGSENVMRIFNNRNSPDGSIDFVVNGGKKMVIDNTGNVGIGTSNPTCKLDVDGGAGVAIYGKSTSNFGIYGISPSHHHAGVYGESDEGSGVWGLHTNSTYSASGVLGQNTGLGSGVYGLSTNGHGVVGNGGSSKYDFYATGPGGDYGAASSIRWKNNIIEIDNPLEKLAGLRGVYFNWDEEHGGGHDVGCIAEEVGKVLPEIVVYEENGIDADGMDYSKLTPLLIEAIKALQKRVEELENK